MAFETLSERLQSAIKKVSRKGKLTEQDVDIMMREVRLALLEADVNIKVTREFINEVKEKAIGETVLKSLTPGQAVIKIVNEELTKLMGDTAEELDFGKSKPAIF
ncbi:MAG: signal recognition particle receptor subunit alpha, partial [Turicibacter sp.]